MPHFSRLSKIVVDVPAGVHAREVTFWGGALGLPLTQIERFPQYYGADFGQEGMGLLVQRTDDGPPRLHLDIHTSDRAAEVRRLTGLGASVLDDGEHWTIMRDPAGLVFCVIPDRTLDATNATLWP